MKIYNIQLICPCYRLFGPSSLNLLNGTQSEDPRAVAPETEPPRLLSINTGQLSRPSC